MKGYDFAEGVREKVMYETPNAFCGFPDRFFPIDEWPPRRPSFGKHRSGRSPLFFPAYGVSAPFLADIPRGGGLPAGAVTAAFAILRRLHAFDLYFFNYIKKYFL